MGVNLSPIVESTPVELSDLRGKTVAIDAYNTIFQFLSIIRQPDGKPLTDGEGMVTSHLSGLLYRTANLIENGIEPTYVFDGKPSELKAGTIEERIARRERATREYEEALREGDMERAFSKAQQTSRITPEILATSKELLGLMGIPVVQAPSDGEAQGAYMCMKGDVSAAASQDYDSVLFGAPTLIRNLTISGRRKVPGRNAYRTVQPEIVDTGRMLSDLGVTREQLVDVCIMMGTDFNPGVPGIGPKKGLKLIQQYGTLEGVIDAKGFDIEGYDEVRRIFLDGPRSDDYSVRPGAVDAEGVLGMMSSHGFSEDRVRTVLMKMEGARKAESDRRKQRSLDSWFRPDPHGQAVDPAALGEEPAVDVPALLEAPELPLRALDVPVDLPAPDAPAAPALVLDVPADVVHGVVQEDTDLRGHLRAEHEPAGELPHHAAGVTPLVAVVAQERHHVGVVEPVLEPLRAVDVDQGPRPVEAEEGDANAAGSERHVELADLVENTMRVGLHSEHASALQSRQSRRTVADDALLQIGYGGFRPPGACL